MVGEAWGGFRAGEVLVCRHCRGSKRAERSSSEMAVEGFEGWGFFDVCIVVRALALSAERPRRKLAWR